MEKKYNVGKIFPPGHFYSPIPDLDEISKREEKYSEENKTKRY